MRAEGLRIGQPVGVPKFLMLPPDEREIVTRLCLVHGLWAAGLERPPGGGAAGPWRSRRRTARQPAGLQHRPRGALGLPLLASGMGGPLGPADQY